MVMLIRLMLQEGIYVYIGTLSPTYEKCPSMVWIPDDRLKRRLQLQIYSQHNIKQLIFY